jgi:hypothetical protein
MDNEESLEQPSPLKAVPSHAAAANPMVSSALDTPRCYGALPEDLEDLDAILVVASMWLEAEHDASRLAAQLSAISVLRWNLKKRWRVGA